MVSKAVKAMNEARKNGPTLKAEQALKSALKRGGLTECGAYVLLIDMWNAAIGKALEGNIEAMKLVIERLDGKPKQQIDANVNVNHAFDQVLIEGRARVADRIDAVEHAQALEHVAADTIQHTVEQSVHNESE